MKGDHIRYCAGYKYQLDEDYSKTNGGCLQVGIYGYDIQTRFITLTRDGFLDIKNYYAWDGCSGPTIDDETNMRGGLIHDALYQLMREGFLPIECKEIADCLLHDICLEDGMAGFRADYYYEGVKLFGYASAKLGANPYPVLTAPCQCN